MGNDKWPERDGRRKGTSCVGFSGWLTIIGLLLPLIFISCSPLYLVQSAVEEARILWNRQPVEELLQREDLDPKLRERLILAQRVREYSRDVLRLNVKGSYASYSARERQHLVTVVSASPKAELRSYTWWFPLVGRVPYKGFFHRDQALAEANKLEESGYDVHLTESDAFSTLGWFDDPIQTQFLRYDKVAYVDLLIHELFHATMYIPGQTDFNETAASFVGHRGAIAFFEWSEGSDADTYAKATRRWRDSLKFSGFLEEVVTRLGRLYQEEAPLEEKLIRKEQILSRSREEFKILQGTLQTKRSSFLEGKLNNAVLLHYRFYYRELGLFEKAYALSGEDLPANLVKIRACCDVGDPFEKLREVVQSSSDSRALMP